ncbi:oxidase ustYa family protein, partial [Aspergillus homomorphus CBS 101889]
IQYLLWQFNGTVGYPSPYAPRSFEEGPTPEIDEAWERFHARPMSVSLEVVEKSGENTDAVRLPDELGGGYLAWAEVNHQLHCLNLLRKAIYWDYYYDITRELQREPPEVYAHLDHCIEMMRQILMCNADTGLQLHHWVRGNPTPIPNSNTWHMCKDFESILDWTHRMQIPEREGYLPILPGSKIYDRQP